MLSSLQLLEATGHPASEPLLLTCLEDPRQNVVEASVAALGACGTHAAVKPLQRHKRKAPGLLKGRIDRAVLQIQSRSGEAAVGGLSIVSSLDVRGQLSLDDAMKGGVSLASPESPDVDGH